MKGVPFVNNNKLYLHGHTCTLVLSKEGLHKGDLFREKWFIKYKGVDLGAEPSCINICYVPPEGTFVENANVVLVDYHFHLFLKSRYATASMSPLPGVFNSL